MDEEKINRTMEKMVELMRNEGVTITEASEIAFRFRNYISDQLHEARRSVLDHATF